jgi:translation initiation factor IF-1
MKIRVGDHVALKGIGLAGYTGTVLSISTLGYVTVQLDAGQQRLGYTILKVRKMNISVLSAACH